MSTDSEVIRILHKAAPAFDKLLIVHEYLKDRLKKNKAYINSVDAPIVASIINQSHFLPIASTFKPFVRLATEYVGIDASSSGSVLSFNIGDVIQSNYAFISDMAVHIEFNPVGIKDGTNKYRYCAYPGLRLFEKVDLIIDDSNTPLVSYDKDFATLQYKMFDRDDHGMRRCLGQQVPLRARAMGDNVSVFMDYGFGPQTFKDYQPRIHMWIPLRFWFCRDIANAVARGVLGSKISIRVTLADQSDILMGIDSNDAKLAGSISDYKITSKLYCNTLHANTDISKELFKDSRINIARSYLKFTETTVLADSGVSLSNEASAVEYMLVGFKDIVNESNFDFWHLYGYNPWNLNVGKNALLAPILKWNESKKKCELLTVAATPIDNLLPIIDTLQVAQEENHDKLLHQKLDPTFYSSYLFNRYETSVIRSPVDSSIFIVPFCTIPGHKNPNGYYPTSAGKLKLSYTSSYISSSTPASIDVFMIKLNILTYLSSKGSRTTTARFIYS